MSNLTLNAEEFNDFLRCVTNLKEECNDIDIHGGMIRQRSNDKTSIFQVDLTPLMPDVTMSISDIKKKLDLFKIFAGQEVNLEIDNEGGFFILSDQFSSLKFMMTTYQFIDNKFMSQDELDAIFNLDEDGLILEHELQSMITDRIRVITQSFNVKAIQVVFDGEEAMITAGTQAKDQFAKFVDGVSTNVVLENCSANLGVIPFSIEHDQDIEFKMYKDPEQDISLNTFTTSLGDCETIIYTRSSLVQDEE